MTGLRRLGVSLGFVFALTGAVAAATLAIVNFVVPASAIGGLVPTPQPTFDIAVAPQAIGGELVVDGERTGTLVLDRATGIGGRYEEQDGVINIRPAEDVVLQGADGRIRFSRTTGEVKQIDFEDLSFYLDSGQCTVTNGAVNEANGLMVALVECPDIDDVRGKGRASITGVVALPVRALGRNDLPRSGGTVDVDGATVTFHEAELILVGQPPNEGERIQLAIFNDDFSSLVHLEYDDEANRYFLGAATRDNETVVLAEPCPITADELGRLDDVTTVVRLTIACTDVALAGGGATSVTGAVVADVIGPIQPEQ
jgi:hypothetical protein